MKLQPSNDSVLNAVIRRPTKYIKTSLTKHLLTGYLHNDLAPARTIIEIDQHNLLPGPEQQAPVLERHGQRAPQQRRSDMRMAVAVMPGVFMMIARVLRGDLFKRGGNVFEQSGFVFDGRDSGGRTGNEDQRLPVHESMTPEQRGDMRRDVDDVRVAARRE